MVAIFALVVTAFADSLHVSEVFSIIARISSFGYHGNIK
jgi:hypothetical protein